MVEFLHKFFAIRNIGYLTKLIKNKQSQRKVFMFRNHIFISRSFVNFKLKF